MRPSSISSKGEVVEDATAEDLLAEIRDLLKEGRGPVEKG